MSTILTKPRALELRLVDLPASIIPDVQASSVRQAQYHGIVVRGYAARTSYYLGERRILVYLTGDDGDGHDLSEPGMPHYAVAEVYAGFDGVAPSEFDDLWNRATLYQESLASALA